MRSILAAALLCSAATAAYAGTDAPPSGPAPSVDAQAEGVKSYPAADFAAQQPNTAYDMVIRLPGFSLDDGSSSALSPGAAGNVLITDGQRPTSKTDDPDQYLETHPDRRQIYASIDPAAPAPASTCRARRWSPTSSRARPRASTATWPWSIFTLKTGATAAGATRGAGATPAARLTGFAADRKFFDDGEAGRGRITSTAGRRGSGFLTSGTTSVRRRRTCANGSFETPLW